MQLSFRIAIPEIFLNVYKLDRFVNIKISDKGVGMSQDRISTLFDGNLISSDYGTEKEKGTGLGLIISKELIEKQGGQYSYQYRRKR
jgi:signal transduction histidine kinase